MRYALALIIIGLGLLFVYSGFKNENPWDVVRGKL